MRRRFTSAIVALAVCGTACGETGQGSSAGREKGANEAAAAIAVGRLALKEYPPFPYPPDYPEYIGLLQKRCGVGYQVVPRPAGVAEADFVREVRGWDDATEAEIKRRFGVNVFDELHEEARRLREATTSPNPARLPPRPEPRDRQPVPRVSRGDVERVIRRDFPAEKIADVLAALKEYDRGGQIRGARVELAILKLAAGNLEALRTHVRTALEDFRDVVAPAEYPLYCKYQIKGDRSMSLGEIYDQDWNQYQEWLNRR